MLRDDSNVGSSMLTRFLAVTIAASLFTSAAFAPLAPAQTAAEHVAAGDKDYAALNATGALGEYKAAIAADSNYEEAYWKASRTLVDLGEYEPDKDKQKDYYAEAKDLATKAVAMKPTGSLASCGVAMGVSSRPSTRRGVFTTSDVTDTVARAGHCAVPSVANTAHPQRRAARATPLT